MNTSLFDLLGLPIEFGVLLLVVAFILFLSPYFSGSDFGVLKIPAFKSATKARLRIVGPIALAVCIFFFLPLWPKHGQHRQQLTLVGERVEGSKAYFSLVNPTEERQFLIHRIAAQVIAREDLVHFYQGPRKLLRASFSKGTQSGDAVTVFGTDNVLRLPPGASDSFACDLNADFIHVIVRFSVEFTELSTASEECIHSDSYYLVEGCTSPLKMQPSTVRRLDLQEVIDEALRFEHDATYRRHKSRLLVSALGTANAHVAVEPLLTILKKGVKRDIEEQRTGDSLVADVVEVLGRLGHARAVAPILEVLETFTDPKYDGTVNHWNAAVALGNLGDARAVPALIEHLDENDPSLFQVYLNQALQRITGEDFGEIEQREYSDDKKQEAINAAKVIASWREWNSRHRR